MTDAGKPMDTPATGTGQHAVGVNPERLLNALPQPVMVLDARGRVARVNASAEAFFHASAAQMDGRRLEDFVAFASPLLALVAQVRATGASVNEYDVDLGMPKTGAHFLVDVYAAPLHDVPDHVLLILQHRSMAQMIGRQLTHRAAARSVSGLAAMLAHEIKNPLSGIRGAAQLLQSELGDEGRALTQLICAETDRICGLVDRMEAFSDDRPIAREALNIHSVLNHVRRLAASGFARDIRFEEHYDPSLPPVRGNHDQLVQAVLNLVKNAAEAIGSERSDGRITLSTAYRPGMRLTLPGSRASSSLPLMIAIADNGPGVPADLRSHIFDPFVSSKASGGGLGLALVAKIIGDHGGVIECDTSADEGALFRVLLPKGGEDLAADATGEQDGQG